MAASPQTKATALRDQIAQGIQSSPAGWITFAEFMDQCLYHSQLGYYARPEIEIGPRGDYYTSVQVSPVFAQLLAEQLQEMWDRLGRPYPFQVVEMGAGSGVMARDLLQYAQEYTPEFSAGLEYRIIERAAGLIRQQQQQLQEFPQVSWWDLDQIEPESITGCFLSNELVDAFPVHRIEWSQGQLWEIYVRVAAGADGFEESLGDLSTPQIQAYLDRLGIQFSSDHYLEGYRTEVNLAALEWQRQIAARLHQGYVLTLDYGYTAERYYHPRRSQGTLLCYRQHTTHTDPYDWVGQQDLTAHVDFTALQIWGAEAGLRTLGLTRQERFLASLGLIERMAALSQAPADQVGSVLKQRQSWQLLMDPMGLGSYYALIQQKGVPDAALETPLRGLQGIGAAQEGQKP